MSKADRAPPIDHAPRVQRALVLHPVWASARDSARSTEARLIEAEGLALALDLDVVARQAPVLRAATPATLLGAGKTAEIGELCRDLELDVAVVDGPLTPGQQRNLEKAWQVKVIDRTGLILEIFARRARTREGRLQVELARLDYERSRLVRTWTHLERQRGGFGVMGGPGETQIETDRRLLAEKIDKLKRDLEDVRRTRALHRSARRRTPFPSLALVGYTNAGKSTLFNALTAAKVEARDLLFATLDPTVRTLSLPDGRPAALSDTVGFISDLPHELVAAFRATLEEIEEADLILHVRDVSSPDAEAEAGDVRTVLSQLDLGGDGGRARIVEVWNKIDQLDPDARAVLETQARRARDNGSPPALAVSALTGEGLPDLLRYLAERIDAAPPLRIALSAADGEMLAWLYRHGRVIERSESEEGALTLDVSLDERALGQFERLYPQAQVSAG